MLLLYEVCKLSNETDFLFNKVFIIPFKIVPLGSYTPMELFPILLVALEVFNRYGLLYAYYTLLDVF